MRCNKCGFAQKDDRIDCMKCGIVFSKMQTKETVLSSPPQSQFVSSGAEVLAADPLGMDPLVGESEIIYEEESPPSFFKGIGHFLFVFGIGSFLLNLFDFEFIILMWIDKWGPETGRSIRIGMIVSGVVCYTLGLARGEADSSDD